MKNILALTLLSTSLILIGCNEDGNKYDIIKPVQNTGDMTFNKNAEVDKKIPSVITPEPIIVVEKENLSPIKQSIKNLKKSLKNKKKEGSLVEKAIIPIAASPDYYNIDKNVRKEMEARNKGITKYLNSNKDIYCFKTAKYGQYGSRYLNKYDLKNGNKKYVKINNNGSALVKETSGIYIVDGKTQKTYNILNCYKDHNYRYENHLNARRINIPTNQIRK